MRRRRGAAAFPLNPMPGEDVLTRLSAFTRPDVHADLADLERGVRAWTPRGTKTGVGPAPAPRRPNLSQDQGQSPLD